MSVRPAHGRAAVAHWAVGLATVAAAIVGVSYAVFGLTWAFGGEDAVSDTAVGALAALALASGAVASLAGFVLAIAAGLSQVRWRQLWLPLGFIPALVVVVALVELLWME